MSNYGHNHEDNIREELLALKYRLEQTEEKFEDIAELARIVEILGEQILGIRNNGGRC